MGIWIAAAVLLALAILPLGVRVRYDNAGFLLSVIAGPIKITVFPIRKKVKKEKTQNKKKKPEKKTVRKESASPEKNTTQPSKAAPVSKEKGGSLTRFLPLVRLGLRFLGEFRRKIRVDRLFLRLILAGDDPCDLAVNYGRIWAVVGNLVPQLERLFVIRKRDIQVECDFTADEICVVACMDVTITLGRLLVLAVYYGVRVLFEFLSMKRKGGGDK